MLPSPLTIGLLLPDVLSTYSDAGNATVLAQRLRWRGIPAQVLRCTADQNPPTSCDIYVLGGGENAAQLFATQWLLSHPQLCAAIADSAVTLAVCAGLQILGRSVTDLHGLTHTGANLLDITTRPRTTRAIGEIVTRCTIPGIGALCGFENHHGATALGPGVSPLGTVRSGVGNTGRRLRPRLEGVHTERIIGTYLHGPVLARNPALADYLLHRVTNQHLTPLHVPDQAALRYTYLNQR